MLRRDYNNFVRSSSATEGKVSNIQISGEKAKKLYLEEVNLVRESKQSLTKNAAVNAQKVSETKHMRQHDQLDVSNLKLFTSVQDNDFDSLRLILDACPDKINTVDEFGWSLLMMACQANSNEAVEELLKRGIDTTVQDKAGNSAQSLIIRNKNSYLARMLLTHGSQHCQSKSRKNIVICQPKKQNIVKEIRHYVCNICDGKMFDNREEHLSSTLHNINASKGRKILTNYVIPQSNKGYQIMIKTGWDIETGLGRNGSGTKYPIKAVQKLDKKGLGHKLKRLKSSNEESIKQQFNKNKHLSDYERNRRIEIEFRREFY